MEHLQLLIFSHYSKYFLYLFPTLSSKKSHILSYDFLVVYKILKLQVFFIFEHVIFEWNCRVTHRMGGVCCCVHTLIVHVLFVSAAGVGKFVCVCLRRR